MISPHEDAWPYILPELGRALSELQRIVESGELLAPGSAFLAMLEARYRNGEALYKREWLDWPDGARFDDEVLQEVADGILYLAMRRVAFPDAGAIA
jgi:hypothetical protein